MGIAHTCLLRAGFEAKDRLEHLAGHSSDGFAPVEASGMCSAPWRKASLVLRGLNFRCMDGIWPACSVGVSGPTKGAAKRRKPRFRVWNKECLVHATQLIEADQHVEKNRQKEEQALQGLAGLLHHKPLQKSDQAQRPSQVDRGHLQYGAAPWIGRSCLANLRTAAVDVEMSFHGASWRPRSQCLLRAKLADATRRNPQSCERETMCRACGPSH